MYWLVVLMSLAIFSLVASGLYLEFRPAQAVRTRAWFKPVLSTQLLGFFGALIGILVLGVGDVMAEAGEAATQAVEISTGMGLAILGVGIPTGLSTIGAGIAVGPIGAASLAAVMERPEALGRSLIFLGLAEGIAIYGLVMSILLLNRI
ncbi:ATP synthase subunit C [Thiorhodovibrio frisius]|uniref:F0F1-type ATP synthase, subunit c/archaeal/vacuolar-type H+-ATPase, subunit K n=1 Tax=Thiorhodovibrio frisius TaxID=631362 RepID=H8Z0Q7_9GAMM|nr:ATP synthase subunit C [Thiorhodovibrio frisius]EIC22398.1 F0F1-type ATP synthase, subunit c/archaeal/vacuolar-type H+-ATPase, subunit K [Thiorhodovibrio frisius]WPL24697.1 V-type ATP synthase subunit K [Thiorhodovibrio frisius]